METKKMEEIKWEKEAVEEQQQEDETSLIVRKSRYGKGNKTTEVAAVYLPASNGHAVAAQNGTQNEKAILGEELKVEEPNEVFEVAVDESKDELSIPGEEKKMEQPEGALEVGANGAKEDEDSTHGEKQQKEGLGIGSEAINGKQQSENLVFYDKVEGSTYTHFGDKQLKDPEDNDKFNIASLDSIVQNSSAIRSTSEGHLENGSGSNIEPSQIPFQDQGKSYKSSKEIECAEVDLINEDDLEVTEFDVENVLQKQTTHDLYCPNCSSCITKRVILRKRKRRIRISDEEVEWNKKKTAAASKLGAATAQSPTDQLQHTDEVGDNDFQLRADEDERSQGPDIFRCLSCFSFFIPIGNGFKSLRLFREKNDKGKVAEEQAPILKEHKETAVGQGSSYQTGPGISSAGGPVAISGNKDTAESRDEILTLPKQKPSSNEKVTVASRDQLNMETTGTEHATMEQFYSYATDQLKEPKSGKEIHVSRESDLLVTAVPMMNQSTNGESMVDAVSFPKDGGLKLLISSSNGSPVSENSKDIPIPDQTVQSGVKVSPPHEKQDARDAAPVESVLENKNMHFSSDKKSGEVDPSGVSQPINTTTKLEVHYAEPLKVDSISYLPAEQGKDAVITIDAQPARSSQTVPDVIHPRETTTPSQPGNGISVAGRARTEDREEFQIEVVKSIVYGGLAESITSLSVISSAAGGGAATLNILALGMANLIGGLFIIFHNLWELRGECIEQVSNQLSEGSVEHKDRYRELLGRKQNFILHATVAIISYLIFGLVPPVVYGFSFHKTDDKQFKLVAVAAASLICVVVLALGKAYVQRSPKPYLKSVMTFLILGFMVSGVSYAAGELVERLLVKLGLFQSGMGSNLLGAETIPAGMAWASY